MRILLVLVLAVLSPWVAEYLVFGTVDRLGLIVFLAPMYGSGAVLIREAARRSRSPWYVVALCGAAYGITEAGLIDQSLFNPDYDEGNDYSGIARIPGLKTSSYSLLTFVVGHVVWSIAVPIAIVEGLAGPRWRARPWLHRPGLIVAALLYAGGALLIHFDVEDGFAPSTPQRAVALGLLVLFLGAALVLGRRRPPLGGRRLSPWWIGLASFVVAAGWIVMPESWYGVAGEVALMAIGIAGLHWAGRQVRWTPLHTVAAAAGPLIAYALTAYVYSVADYPGDQGNPATEHLSEAVFTILALALVAGAAWRSRPQTAEGPA